MGTRPRFTAYITKYALTTGIRVELVEETSTPGMVAIIDDCRRGPWPELYHGEGRQWHRIRAEAVKRAEEMRDRKIASLQKQILRLKSMRFDDFKESP